MVEFLRIFYHYTIVLLFLRGARNITAFSSISNFPRAFQSFLKQLLGPQNRVAYKEMRVLCLGSSKVIESLKTTELKIKLDITTAGILKPIFVNKSAGSSRRAILQKYLCSFFPGVTFLKSISRNTSNFPGGLDVIRKHMNFPGEDTILL